MSDALKQTGVEYGPWQRTKTIHYEHGAKVIAVESMTEDAMRAQLAEAVGLIGILRNGISHAQMAPCLDASWHMQAEGFVRQADAFIAAQVSS